MNYAKMRKSVFSLVATLLVLFLIAWIWTVISEVQAINIPRYEQGEHKGAKYCATCHQEIYNQWLEFSRHAIATSDPSFHHYKDLFVSNFVHNAAMGEEMCYACHGSKKVNEGVNCETCHGIEISGAFDMETHVKKHKPSGGRLGKSEFCGKCHEIENPLSGDLIIASYTEWQGSEAAQDGMTCQNCHMKPRAGDLPYHGFDTLIRNPGIYDGDLSISDINLQFSALKLTVENHIAGHGIPAGGPSNVLVLAAIFKDQKGDTLHIATRSFSRNFSLMPIIGIMPFGLIQDTQLKSGEKRHVSLKLPDALAKEDIVKIELTLRFYKVSDEHQGDIAKAHWISDPVVTEELTF